MTPKEKAKQLVEKFAAYSYYSRSDSIEVMAGNQLATAKQCALIAVDEIINELSGVGINAFAEYRIPEYYKQVKEEILKL